MNLIIDIGNTYTKFALFQVGELQELQHSSDAWQEVLEQIVADTHIEQSIISSVVNIPPNLLEYVRTLPFPHLFLRSNTPIPLQLNYQSLQTIGVDRIAAAVGARNACPDSNILLVDAGTAITYDFLSADGVYHGGNIAPGKQLRFTSMHNRIPQLPIVDENGEAPICGNDTPKALRGGVIQGIIHEINGYLQYYKQTYPNVILAITGGDARLFEPYLTMHQLHTDPYLVLKGLNYILNYQHA